MLNGGAGVDTVSYASASSAVRVNLALTSAQNTVGAGSDTLWYFENLSGSDFDDSLVGNAGNNVLTGGLGNDTLNGGAGADRMVGGLGDDTYIVGASGDVVVEHAGEGVDTVHALISYTLGANLENLTLFGTGPLNGTGGAGNNVIVGNAAKNILSGGEGDDILDGGLGSDVLLGGAGDDSLIYDSADGGIHGGDGLDTLRLSGGGETLNLSLIADTRISEVEVIDLTGSGANSLVLALSDVLAISSSTDTLRIVEATGDELIALDAQAWTRGADQVIGADTYYSYTQTFAQLLVDSDVITNIA